ncbi:MAG: DUF72 domain-containing protein [Candidatus Bipolaricaulota bacterium]|nr:DUF72 domain-containing protein [Candidatus Bipolaricaulota bacterium]
MEVRIGCCGWSALRPEEDARGRHRLQLYAARFSLVEVNSTFYRIPRPETVRRWRDLADRMNPRFEFAVKAYRGITHSARFRGPQAHDGFARSVEVARALRARVLLLQSPPSFAPAPAHEEALVRFLSEVDRSGLTLVWEPRGQWGEDPERVAALCRELSLVHCTDPFRALPVTGGLAYLRLHGSPPGARMYRYTYTDQDLARLRDWVLGLDAALVYVLFNNDTMASDAQRFVRMWDER